MPQCARHGAGLVELVPEPLLAQAVLPVEILEIDAVLRARVLLRKPLPRAGVVLVRRHTLAPVVLCRAVLETRDELVEAVDRRRVPAGEVDIALPERRALLGCRQRRTVAVLDLLSDEIASHVGCHVRRDLRAPLTHRCLGPAPEPAACRKVPADGVVLRARFARKLKLRRACAQTLRERKPLACVLVETPDVVRLHPTRIRRVLCELHLLGDDGIVGLGEILRDELKLGRGELTEVEARELDRLDDLHRLLELSETALPHGEKPGDSGNSPTDAATDSAVDPAEIIYSEDQPIKLDAAFQRRAHSQPPWYFELDTATRLLCEQYRVRDLQGFGIAEAGVAISAAGCLLQYVKDTLCTDIHHLQPLRYEQLGELLLIDANSRRNLELTRSINADSPNNSLLGIIDFCSTAMGHRELVRWIQKPLRDQARVRERHHAVAAMLDDHRFEMLGEMLREIGDIERILARVALLSARPRDLSTLATTLQLLPGLQLQLSPLDSPLLQRLAQSISTHPEIVALLDAAIIAEPPLLIRDGGVIKTGFDPELDELRELSANADQFLVDMETQEQQKTGIQSLKVAYNRVHGFYIEIGKTHADKVPTEYVRRQTLKAVERYITPELKAFEDKVLSARERALAREKFLYEALLAQLGDGLAPLQQCAVSLAQLDVLNCFACAASQRDWNAPELSDERLLEIEAGRHPVVEQSLEQPFVANDVLLDEHSSMLLITGPNMGGKSTYMRQTALIVILAYMGSYVPARRAVLGPVDQVFTRIGASDDLSGGRSTFMVEMTEAANILNNASANSLVLMDEIGRGTSTFDGLALAWACADHLAQKTHAFTLVRHPLLRTDPTAGTVFQHSQRAP